MVFSLLVLVCRQGAPRHFFAYLCLHAKVGTAPVAVRTVPQFATTCVLHTVRFLSACTHPMRTSQWPGPRWRGMLATHAQRAPCACMDLSRRCAWAGRARRQPLDRSPTRTICGTTAAKSRTCTRQVRQARQAQPWALLSMKQLVRQLLCEYLRLAWCSRCVHLQQQCQGDPPQSLHRPQAPAGTPSTECLASHGDAGAERTHAHHHSQCPSSPVK